MEDYFRSLNRPLTPAEVNAATVEKIQMEIVDAAEEKRTVLLARSKALGATREALAANGEASGQALAAIQEELVEIGEELRANGASAVLALGRIMKDLLPEDVDGDTGIGRE